MPRMTKQTRAVLAEFLKDPDAELYGREIKLATDIQAGTLYPILKRLEEEGWLTSRWEEVPATRGVPPRCYYRLTSEGRAGMRK